VRRGGIPESAPRELDGVVLLSIEEFAVNRLRETFHRWVRTLTFPVCDGALGEALPHVPARALGGGRPTDDREDHERAIDILESVGPALKRRLLIHRTELTEDIRRQLESAGAAARREEDERYRQRQGEVSALIKQQTIARLESELERLDEQRSRGLLFNQEERFAEIERSREEKEQEIKRRRHDYDEIRERLANERTRILERLLPARFTLADEAQVFPVTLEVRLPEQRA